MKSVKSYYHHARALRALYWMQIVVFGNLVEVYGGIVFSLTALTAPIRHLLPSHFSHHRDSRRALREAGKFLHCGEDL